METVDTKKAEKVCCWFNFAVSRNLTILRLKLNCKHARSQEWGWVRPKNKENL